MEHISSFRTGSRQLFGQFYGRNADHQKNRSDFLIDEKNYETNFLHRALHGNAGMVCNSCKKEPINSDIEGPLAIIRVHHESGTMKYILANAFTIVSNFGWWKWQKNRNPRINLIPRTVSI